MHPRDEMRVRKLNRLILAQQSMLVIREGCQRVLDKNEGADFDRNERMLFSTGIAVLYTSPFTAADELGQLEDEYSKFEEAELKKTHDNLMYVRNKIFAHRDLKNATVNFEHGSEKLFQIAIVVDVLGNVRHATPHLVFLAPQLEQAARLASFQEHRLGREIHKLLGKLTDKKIISPGTYVLGKSFPPSS
jgi:hypothetical protein